MPEQPWLQYLNNRQPPLTGQILSDGTPVDLTGVTSVKLQMRAVGSSTLKVDTAAVVTDAVNGRVRYDWAALDVDTADYYAGWWRVTLASGQFEDTPEFLIEVRAHGPVTNQYISVEELKASLSIGGEPYADLDIARALRSASNVVNSITGRIFSAATSGTQTFTPVGERYLYIGNVTTITSVTVDGAAWVQGTDYYLDGGDTLRVLGGKRFPRSAQSVVVVANFGFAAVPPEIIEATQIIATQLIRRVREAPFGILATAMDGPAIRLGRFDPQVDALLAEYRRSSMVE